MLIAIPRFVLALLIRISTNISAQLHINSLIVIPRDRLALLSILLDDSNSEIKLERRWREK